MKKFALIVFYSIFNIMYHYARILSRNVIYLEQKAFNLTISILPILAAPIDQGFCNQAAAFKWRDISQRAVEKSGCVMA